MGRSQKRKGYRVEKALVDALRKVGIEAKRVPLSGATDFAKGDVALCEWKIEVKARKEGFKQLYKWLENADILPLKANRKPFLIVMPLENFIALLKGGGPCEGGDTGRDHHAPSGDL